jgi:1-aminocyclopropane-1-carboxylate deaminase/D-cysteine desulfhydrase-like pyridoxal-dependent ACC family enzyme
LLTDHSFALKPAPLQPLHSALLEHAGIELLVKREDLIDPELGGNKWHKLKHNLHAARQQNHHTLLTFGGAYSNHIYATAAAGKRFGFNTIGVIRGEPQGTLNPTLSFARDCGMHLHYLDRAIYREKTSPTVIQQLKDLFGDFYLIPEGGSNALAVQGCREMVQAIDQPFDFICCACGTGATLAGISLGLTAQQQAIGFAVLKGGDFLQNDISRMRAQFTDRSSDQWHIETGYHFGGYAKTNAELITFMQSIRNEFDIELDAVYTAKMFYGVFDLIKQDYFKPGSRIIVLHSGGLQGNAGFAELN